MIDYAKHFTTAGGGREENKGLDAYAKREYPQYNDLFLMRPASKRMDRLIRMYWAFERRVRK